MQFCDLDDVGGSLDRWLMCALGCLPQVVRLLADRFT
jgi:hypothetical protein